MRRIFLHINVSLDGYICDADGEIDWSFSDAEFQQYLDEMLGSIGGMVLGRVAHEQLASYWPVAGEEVSTVQRRQMHELPKYVLSRTLDGTDWHGAELLGPEPFATLDRLKREVGGDIAVFAGGSAATSLLEAGLLDELRLVLNPVLLGGGKRLFDERYPRMAWGLVGTRTFGSGALLVTYERAGIGTRPPRR